MTHNMLLGTWDYNATAIALSICGLVVTTAGAIVAVWTLVRVGTIKQAQRQALVGASEKRSIEVLQEATDELERVRLELNHVSKIDRMSSGERGRLGLLLGGLSDHLGRVSI